MYSELEKQAKQESSAFKDSLQYLIDTQNEQRAADERTAALRYQQLVDQINAQREPLLQQYGLDTQGAYVNKMLSGRDLENKLARLGLSTQGFGVSQQMANETAYGQNLNQLMLQRNRSLQDIERQLSSAQGEQLARESELESLYSGRLAELNKYITEASENKYQSVYNQLFQAQQYQDALKQQELDNAYRQSQLKAAKSSGGGSSKSSSGASFTSGGTSSGLDLNKIVTANYTPTMSLKAMEWLNKNVSKDTIKNKGISIQDLTQRLTAGYNTGVLSDNDIKLILKSYGLE